MNNFKVGDIFAINGCLLSLVKVIEISEQTEKVFLGYISNKHCFSFWLPNKILKNCKKATRKDWYRVIRLYNKINI